MAPACFGPVVYFSTTGLQRIRVERREDGISIDQIVLSPGTYLSTAARRHEERHAHSPTRFLMA